MPPQSADADSPEGQPAVSPVDADVADDSRDDGPTLIFGPFRFTPSALTIDHSGDYGGGSTDGPGGFHGPPIERWAGPLHFALWCQQASPWWIGDLLNAGEARFGEMFSQVCNGSVSADQLQRYESVARRVPPENRRPALSWSAHAAVARLPHATQRKLLERAEVSGWTSTVLLRKAREEVARRKRLGHPLDESDSGDDTTAADSFAVDPYDLS